MLAFAANSLLCRAALRHTAIDAATFTVIRIVFGAVALLLVTTARNGRWVTAGNWLSAVALFAYAAAFSFAYVSLSAGTGALLLFAAVQATMVVWGLHKGERLRLPQVIGLGLALCSLVVLLLPGLTAPPLLGSALMVAAGIAWGTYSLRGKAEQDPARATAGNFIRAVPLAAVLAIAFLPRARLDRAGIAYAILSGAITSGLGYVVWYIVLPRLKAASAATVQLSVPVLAASAGIVFLAEPPTLQFAIASLAVLGGIALVVSGKPARPA